jgi:hypothetical protein
MGSRPLSSSTNRKPRRRGGAVLGYLLPLLPVDLGFPIHGAWNCGLHRGFQRKGSCDRMASVASRGNGVTRTLDVWDGTLRIPQRRGEPCGPILAKARGDADRRDPGGAALFRPQAIRTEEVAGPRQPTNSPTPRTLLASRRSPARCTPPRSSRYASCRAGESAACRASARRSRRAGCRPE